MKRNVWFWIIVHNIQNASIHFPLWSIHFPLWSITQLHWLRKLVERKGPCSTTHLSCWFSVLQPVKLILKKLFIPIILIFSFYNHRPAKLIEIVKKRFISLSGVIFEGYSVSNICIYEDAAVRFLTVANFQSASSRSSPKSDESN